MAKKNTITSYRFNRRLRNVPVPQKVLDRLSDPSSPHAGLTVKARQRLKRKKK